MLDQNYLNGDGLSYIGYKMLMSYDTETTWLQVSSIPTTV